jgi:glycosyltransferase involved in cell wall biosynthesis
MQNNSFTIIVNYHKEGYLLKEAIDSLLSNNINSFKHEILLVGDKPDSLTLYIAKLYAKNFSLSIFNYVTDEASGYGISNSRNLGIKLSSKDIIFFLDGDDLFLNSKIYTVMDLFNNNSNLLFVYHDYNIFSNNNAHNIYRNIRLWNANTKYKYAMYRNIGFSTIALKSSIAKKFQFNSFPVAEDADWILRIFSVLHNNEIFKIPNCLSLYRINFNSRSSNKLKNIKILFNIYNLNFNSVYSIFFISVSTLIWSLNFVLRKIYH